MEIKRGNPKAFEELSLRIQQLRGLETKVGWFSTSKYPDGTPVAYAAALNELGHGPTPPRPFFRPTVNEKKSIWIDQTALDSKQVIAGTMTPFNAMDRLGQRVENDVLQTIVDLHNPPLSPITIELRAMKKADPNLRITGKIVGQAAARVNAPGYVQPSGVSIKPLNDSGLMIATLTHTTEQTS